MIEWRDERLQGQPMYNVLGTPNINGVHFRLANKIVQPGTPFSAENMTAIVQKFRAGRYFYYSGEKTVTTAFPPADNGLREGIFLAEARGGMELTAEGTVYMVVDGSTQRLESPAGWPVMRDCAIYCEMGEEVAGIIA